MTAPSRRPRSCSPPLRKMGSCDGKKNSPRMIDIHPRARTENSETRRLRHERELTRKSDARGKKMRARASGNRDLRTTQLLIKMSLPKPSCHIIYATNVLCGCRAAAAGLWLLRLSRAAARLFCGLRPAAPTAPPASRAGSTKCPAAFRQAWSALRLAAPVTRGCTAS